MGRSAAVLGATGLVGGHCLEQLLEDPSYESVVTLSRRELSARSAHHRAAIVDFNRPETLAPYLDVDDLFCCLGTTIRQAGSRAAFRKVDFEYPLAAAEILARRPGAQLLLVSAVGASATSRVFYNRVKGELEQALSALPFRAVHIFRPSLLLGQRSQARPLERLAQLLAPTVTPLLSGPLSKFRPIEAAQVARAMVAIAQSDKPGVNYYESNVIDGIGVPAPGA